MQHNTTADENSTTIDDGTDVPAFIAERTLSAAADGEVHRASFSDPSAAFMDAHQPIIIKLTVDLDGGLIVYHDENTTLRRVFDDSEDAAAAYVNTVEETAGDYERNDLEYEFDYEVGDGPAFEFEV